MTKELPVTDDPEIDNLPFEKRYRVCMATATATAIDEQFLAENRQCHTFIRPAFPDEIPSVNPGQVWLVAVRRDHSGGSCRARIRLRTNLTPDELIRNDELMSVLRWRYGQPPEASGAEGNPEGFPSKVPLRAYIVDRQSIIIC
jgi:hypothetical protein